MEMTADHLHAAYASVVQSLAHENALLRAELARLVEAQRTSEERSGE